MICTQFPPLNIGRMAKINMMRYTDQSLTLCQSRLTVYRKICTKDTEIAKQYRMNM